MASPEKLIDEQKREIESHLRGLFRFYLDFTWSDFETLSTVSIRSSGVPVLCVNLPAGGFDDRLGSINFEDGTIEFSVFFHEETSE